MPPNICHSEPAKNLAKPRLTWRSVKQRSLVIRSFASRVPIRIGTTQDDWGGGSFPTATVPSRMYFVGNLFVIDPGLALPYDERLCQDDVLLTVLL